jgi:zinc/manganese transport system permease protein
VSWSAVDTSILLPAFLAGLLVLTTHVPLGIHVLSKGIVFIDLAIAQIAGLGVIVAGLVDIEPGGWQVQCAAALASLAGSLLLTWTERKWPDVQEAQIGVVFVLAATGGILLLAKNPHGGEYLRDLLAGQILWVGYRQLPVPLAVSVLTLAVLWGLRGRLSQLVFYLVFAIAVTASVQLIGVYLVFATLIVPALGSRRVVPPRTRLLLAYGIGVLGYAAGLVLSSALDLPSGALIVWCLVALAIAAYAATGRRPRLAAAGAS